MPVLTTDELIDSTLDIMCFQEVTHVFLETFKCSDWIRSNYIISDSVGTSLRGKTLQYGVLTLLKKNVEQVVMSIHDVNSSMNRRPLLSDFMLGDVKVRVVNMHLESMGFSAVRKHQYEHCFRLLQEENAADVWIFTGDFNFDPQQSAEKENLPPGFTDAWLGQHGERSGTTFPIDGTRIDRVLYKSSVFKVSKMEVIGTEETILSESPSPLHDFDAVLEPGVAAAA